MEFWIVILIIGSILYFSNLKNPNKQVQRPNSDGEKWMEMPSKQALLDILKNISGFKANRIIESKQAFYAFGIESSSGKMAFVNCDLAVTILQPQDIESLEIAVRKKPEENMNIINIDTCIYLNIKRKQHSSPFVQIEFFNANKLINRAQTPIKNQLMLKTIYEEELAQCRQITGIIKEQINKVLQKSTSQKPQSANQAKPVENTTTPKPEASQPENPRSINLSEVIANIERRKKSEPELSKPVNSAKPEIQDYIKREDPIIPQPAVEEKNTSNTTKGKVGLSIAEIEDKTKGTFIPSDILSIISDARMKGETIVYFTAEQIKTLEDNTLGYNNSFSSNQNDSFLSYRPVNYQSNYKEEG
ncbi:hypothetical protein [Dysgonomonas sp. 520]|uniref:hypothetical protein n=1 Tax=Dysgonomonas sp. 520 TaxID=2302931 RepID=UPI0013D58C4C|nr:hypothetical protein [Dysgonomonas sp. 520]NDW10094.1 hypothetical protein [Dysgonomonas sp. 520]